MKRGRHSDKPMRRGRRSNKPMRRVSRALRIASAAILLAIVLRNRGQISDRIRSFNKHILNPFVLKSAGTVRSPFAVVRHIGRRSGKTYETPILLAPVADGFIIELTYGPDVDWYRNVLAAGQCTILWHGQEYTSEKPEPIDAETGLQAFPLFARLMMRLLVRRHFAKLKCQLASA